MDIRKIKKLIELLEESDVEELEIQEGDDSHFPPSRTRRRWTLHQPLRGTGPPGCPSSGTCG